MREVRKTLSTNLIGRKESTATMSLYLRAVRDDGSSETLSKVADEMRTRLPDWMTNGFNSSLSLVKKKLSKTLVTGEEEYIIDNIKQVENCIKTIPMHKFSFEGVQYEWQDGIYMKKVREMERGQSFGELAISTEGAKRSATIKCMTDCEFATLNKESFKRSMQSVEQNRVKKKINRLQQMPLFAAMNRKQVQNYLDKLEKRKFTLKQVVYQSGDPASHVFIVLDGVFE